MGFRVDEEWVNTVNNWLVMLNSGLRVSEWFDSGLLVFNSGLYNSVL